MEKSSTQFTYDSKWESVEFQKPQKKIVLFDDVAKYQKLTVHDDYLAFLVKLQQSIVSKKISDTKPIEKFNVFNSYFETLQQILKDTPPIDQPMRYGNRAFKDWMAKAVEHTDKFLDQIVPEKIKGCKQELKTYINQSFGSNVRIDYGTGHQMSFMFFCWAIYRLGFCKDDELENLIRQVFYKYIALMRKVQVQYMLQPAGSHGVWGLDDYHFLPFLLGAGEILGNSELQSPQCIINASLVQKYKDEYMYLNCIKFIMQAKKGTGFAQSSPVLHNISGAANWQKIKGGMIKMYRAQVLGKHPVIKHQYFGTIIPYK